MKPIAKKNFSINGVFYVEGNEVKAKDIEELIRLNERGFINPMTIKEIQDYFIKPEIKKIKDKEEKKNEFSSNTIKY